MDWNSSSPQPTQEAHKQDQKDSALETFTNDLTRINSYLRDASQCILNLGTRNDSIKLRTSLQKLEEQICNDLSSGIDQLNKHKYNIDKARYNKLLSEFQKLKEKHTLLTRDSVEKRREYPIPINPDATYIDNGTPPQEFQEKADPQEINIQLDRSERFVEDRNEEMIVLNQQVKEVSDLMLDVNKLVVEQGENINEVKYNVEMSDIHTEKGTKELDKASKYAISFRKKKLCLAVLLAAILAIVTVVIISTLPDNPPESTPGD